MNTMSLAWTNAKTARAFHNKGTAKQYLSGSLKLAHKGINLKHALVSSVVVGSFLALNLGIGLGYLVASSMY